MGTKSGCGCTGGARKKRGTSKTTKRGGGIISTAAAPVALYGLARMAHRGNSKHSRSQKTRRGMRGGRFDEKKIKEYNQALKKQKGEKPISFKNYKPTKTFAMKQKGGSVLGNALPSLVLYGLARGMRGTKKNTNHNGNKTRKMRRHSRRGRRM